MQVFHCDHCNELVFFENHLCVSCGHALAYLPDLSMICSLEQVDNGSWQTPLPEAKDKTYRLCENYSTANVCNWAVPAGDTHTLCASCRLTKTIPDMTVPGNAEAWYKLEIAKRRLVYSLSTLGLPLLNKQDDATHGLAFEFLSDVVEPNGEIKTVLSGHDEGLIVINLAEADDAERERRRVMLHEPYRTLLGHFRHESGHYYWDRLIRDSSRLEAFRAVFGDEQVDYQASLEKHYQFGPAPDWQANFVSAYSTVHPWEDWAETWAHYLHMTDALETAVACGLSLRPMRKNEPVFKTTGNPHSFDVLIERWFPLAYVLNNLNRSLGLHDAYPFVLSPSVVNKLRFVHETIYTVTTTPPTPHVSQPVRQQPVAQLAPATGNGAVPGSV